MAENHRRRRDVQHVVHGRRGHVRYVDHHTEAIHLQDDGLAERTKSAVDRYCVWIVVLLRIIGPRRWTGVGQSHVSHSQRVERSQNGQGTVDGMSALETDQAGNFTPRKYVFDVCELNNRRIFVWCSVIFVLNLLSRTLGCFGQFKRVRIHVYHPQDHVHIFQGLLNRFSVLGVAFGKSYPKLQKRFIFDFIDFFFNFQF